MSQAMKKRRKWLFPLLILTVCLSAVIIWHRAHSFSGSRWINDPDARDMMVNDLINRVGLLGLTEEEVTDLLGREDSQQSAFKIDRTYYPPESTLVYYIGEDLLERKWLILSLQNGIVDSISIDVT